MPPPSTQDIADILSSNTSMAEQDKAI